MGDYCPQCGHRVDKQKAFYCPECGHQFWQSKYAFIEYRKEHKSEFASQNGVTHKTGKTEQEPAQKTIKQAKSHWWIWILAILVVIIAYQPIIDQLTISSANPVMVSLAQKAGMSRKGELLFLRANPQLDTDSQMVADCPELAKALNSNGFIEQGCYDPQANKIFIRKMPADLSNLEVVTAAYEMLHIVYINLSNTDSASALNQSIEKNFTNIDAVELNTQVASFEKTEPGMRDLELFSLLGTEYSNITSDLSSYYKPYFTNILVNVAFNNQITNTFKDYEAKLNQLQSTINSYNAQADANMKAANTAYGYSVGWARMGNAYQNNYNYNIYVTDFNKAKAAIVAANNAVDQYNSLLGAYNTLVTEYNGTQPVAQIQSTPQPQASQQK